MASSSFEPRTASNPSAFTTTPLYHLSYLYNIYKQIDIKQNFGPAKNRGPRRLPYLATLRGAPCLNSKVNYDGLIPWGCSTRRTWLRYYDVDSLSLHPSNLEHKMMVM